MIQYTLRYQTRNEEIIAKLREAAAVSASADPHTRGKRLVAEAATLMALIHGGDWRVQFEPENGLVQIARRL